MISTLLSIACKNAEAHPLESSGQADSCVFLIFSFKKTSSVLKIHYDPCSVYIKVSAIYPNQFFFKNKTLDFYLLKFMKKIIKLGLRMTSKVFRLMYSLCLAV